MKKWTKLGIGLGALVLAIAAGTGAYAMRGGSEAPAKDDVVSRDGQRHAAPESDGGGSAVSAMCAEGVTDCVDTFVDAGGDEAKCAADGPCDMVAGGNGECPPGMACIEPWLMDPPLCPDGVPYEECARFAPYPCAESGAGAGTAVAREESAGAGGPTTEITPMPPVDMTPVDPAPGEPCIPIYPCAMPMPMPPVDAMPIDPAPGERCLPVDPCVMPMYPEPAPGDDYEILPMPMPCEPIPVEPCDDTGGARCLPPDCAVSSDGSIACVDAPAPECPSNHPAVSCMAPGSEPPDVGVGGGETPFDPNHE